MSKLGDKSKPYIISEIGCNHNGDLDLARKMIKISKDCGCSAIKLQLWHQHQLATNDYLNDLNSGAVKFENVKQFRTEEMGLMNIFEQNEKFSIWEKEHEELFNYCRKIDIEYSSSPNDKEGIDFLIDQRAAFVKLSSMDFNNLELLEYMISKEYPAVLSTGMATLADIDRFLTMVPEKSKKNITLLHCVSIYPTKDWMVNLNFLRTLMNLTDIDIGFSDHTAGYAIPLASVALGATVIEKHFTLDRGMPGWDHNNSIEPDEMAILCRESQRIIDAMGSTYKPLIKEEQEKREKFRRSYVTLRNMSAGEIIKREDLTLKRPGTGIQADELRYLVGRTLKNNLSEDKTITWEDLV